MKSLRLYFLLIFLLLTLSMMAQDQLYLQGVCVNEKGRAIENVSVYVNDSLLVSITDENGHFALSRPVVGQKIRFAHIVYEPMTYTIKEKDLIGQELKIEMETKSHELLEVEVTANAPHIAFDNPVRSVLDYVIADDGIYLLAYRSRNTSVLHLSFEMDTLHELILSSAYKNLYKDFYGFVHMVSDENACQLGFRMTTDGRKKDMFLCAPLSLNLFYKNFAPIVAASDSVVITGRYAFYGTEQYYYCVTPTADTMYLLEHIVDEKMRDDIIDLFRFGVDKFHYYALNFYPTMFYIYNPIYCLDNKFYLFAYADDETIVYDAVGKELERYPLVYHEQTRWDGTMVQDGRWKKSMIVDRAQREFYSFFVDDGLYTLMRIDLLTGTATPVLDLSGYPFAEMLRVHNRVLYFLYPTGNNHRQALFQVKLEL
ncbi:MAG: carboxypeptidase-like regulatory domain-containing protein [Bacteroidales bacterium]|nr:carboxypeptidase-like regulatory domain-containing protein [Bacteroidales bacterium]